MKIKVLRRGANTHTAHTYSKPKMASEKLFSCEYYLHNLNLHLPIGTRGARTHTHHAAYAAHECIYAQNMITYGIDNQFVCTCLSQHCNWNQMRTKETKEREKASFHDSRTQLLLGSCGKLAKSEKKQRL